MPRKNGTEDTQGTGSDEKKAGAQQLPPLPFYYQLAQIKPEHTVRYSQFRVFLNNILRDVYLQLSNNLNDTCANTWRNYLPLSPVLPTSIIEKRFKQLEFLAQESIRSLITVETDDMTIIGAVYHVYQELLNENVMGLDLLTLFNSDRDKLKQNITALVKGHREKTIQFYIGLVPSANAAVRRPIDLLVQVSTDDSARVDNISKRPYQNVRSRRLQSRPTSRASLAPDSPVPAQHLEGDQKFTNASPSSSPFHAGREAELEARILRLTREVASLQQQLKEISNQKDNEFHTISLEDSPARPLPPSSTVPSPQEDYKLYAVLRELREKNDSLQQQLNEQAQKAKQDLEDTKAALRRENEDGLFSNTGTVIGSYEAALHQREAELEEEHKRAIADLKQLHFQEMTKKEQTIAALDERLERKTQENELRGALQRHEISKLQAENKILSLTQEAMRKDLFAITQLLTKAVSAGATEELKGGLSEFRELRQQHELELATQIEEVRTQEKQKAALSAAQSPHTPPHSRLSLDASSRDRSNSGRVRGGGSHVIPGVASPLSPVKKSGSDIPDRKGSRDKSTIMQDLAIGSPVAGTSFLIPSPNKDPHATTSSSPSGSPATPLSLPAESNTVVVSF